MCYYCCFTIVKAFLSSIICCDYTVPFFRGYTLNILSNISDMINFIFLFVQMCKIECFRFYIFNYFIALLTINFFNIIFS